MLVPIFNACSLGSAKINKLPLERAGALEARIGFHHCKH